MTRRHCYFLITLFVIAQWATHSYAAPLVSASRWDVGVSPYQFSMQTDLSRALKDYRKSVNQTGIEPEPDRQIRAETDRLTQLLTSRGYYQANIESVYDEEKAKPRYQVTLGDRYIISAISITGNALPEDDDWQAIDVGDPLNAVDIVAQQSVIRQRIRQQSCYFETSVTHSVTLNDEQRTGEVTFMTRAEKPATFGDVTFEGADEVTTTFLERAAGLRSGNCYQRADIDSAVISLFDTGLFSQVRPTVRLTESNQVDVNFIVVKREDRTLSAAIGYETEIGPIASLGWQHRDLLGEAQSLSLGLSVQANLQEATAGVVVPSFLDRRNRLSWQNTLAHGSGDIEYYEISSALTLERQASSQNYFEYGIGVTQLNEYTDDQWTTYRQFRVPLGYQFDSVFDPFNPTNGYRYSLDIEPVWDIDENFTPFLLTGLGVQGFFGLDDQVTFASRLQWNSLWYGGVLNSSLDNVPETEWLTAGGSTSIRGYAYQSISIENSESAGATQRWLAINELRLRLSETWGLVGFIDTGTVGDEANPFKQSNWYSGAGAGIRFFTRFAPLRVDVAVPLTPRDSDAAFLIYVSLGQSF